MKPAPFEYHRVHRLEDAFALLDQHGDEACLLAGGQSLVPMLNLRIARFGHLIDINHLPDLDLVCELGGGIGIGALVRHESIERSALLRERCPILPVAAHNVGHYAIRQRGTLGGSLALADPAAELPLIATLLDAELELASATGPRTVRARDFFLSVFTTTLTSNEILVRAMFPMLQPGAGWGLRWLCRRAGDFSIVTAAVTVQRAARGPIERLRLALGGVGPTPIALDALERSEVGLIPDERWPATVAARAAAQVEPQGDPHASADYRRELVRVLLARSLGDALARTNGEG